MAKIGAKSEQKMKKLGSKIGAKNDKINKSKKILKRRKSEQKMKKME